MTSSHPIRTAVAAAALALAMSSPALAQQDLRMPDTRDAAIAATQTQDLRSPDARDAARAGEIAQMMRNFHPAPVRPTPAQPVVVTDTETPWLPIALMGAFSLVVVALSVTYAARVRRRTIGIAS
jgi:hypothetical protein